MRCGLLGQKLGHSYSPYIHNFLGNYTYELFEIQPDELSDFLQNGDFSGLNVTIPYKKAVISFCHELSPVAAKTGAVNTIIRRKDGTLFGHNTDYFGFSSMLAQSGLSIKGKKVLVLGSGGASATVSSVLKDAGAQVIFISRTGDNNYQNLDRHQDASVIVNTTPVGMYPSNGDSPLNLDAFPSLEGVLDLIYNPARTALLMEAETRGIVAKNGLFMLVAQAAESAQWFTNTKISMDRIANIHSKLQAQMANIILIGMPGCGKTTIGKKLAEALGRKFVDSDELIEKTHKMSASNIIKNFGEKKFRQIETETLKRVSINSGIIIATGGGCVTQPENYNILHQNGTIYFLNRNLNALATEDRPLSQCNHLEDLYCERKQLYKDFSDYTIDNNQDIRSTVEAIMEQENSYENSCH